MHVDLLTENRWGFSYETYAATKVKAAFDQLGVSYRHLRIDDGDFYRQFMSQTPDAVLFFEKLEVKENPIAQFIECPKFHWESRWVSETSLRADSQYAQIGYFDPTVEGANLTFLPHAVSVDMKQEVKRPFDLIAFIDVIDPLNQRESWTRVFGEEAMAPLLNSALDDPRAFRETHEKTELEWELVNHLTLPVHLFGKHIGRHLLHRLPRPLTLHTNLHYLSALRVLSKSKILLAHQQTGGCDGWFLPALFSGSLVITNETPYLREIVDHQFEIFYPTRDWEALEERARFFLEHPKKRKEVVRALQEHLKPLHNWNVRTEQLISHLGAL